MSSLGAFLTVVRGLPLPNHVQEPERGEGDGHCHQSKDDEETPSVRWMLSHIEEQNPLVIGNTEVKP